ncbi:MAG: transcriptional repressor [Pseudomonadota bacterium]
MRLRNAAVRVTPARVNVLTTLLEAGRALSHQDIQDAFVAMDRVTLYRALDCLTEAGLAHKIAGDDRVFRYSAGDQHGERSTGKDMGQSNQHISLKQAPPQHAHGHFKCTRCARVFCLDGGADDPLWASLLPSTAGQRGGGERIQNALQQALGKGFQSHDIELTVKGWCADCAH